MNDLKIFHTLLKLCWAANNNTFTILASFNSLVYQAYFKRNQEIRVLFK